MFVIREIAYQILQFVLSVRQSRMCLSNFKTLHQHGRRNTAENYISQGVKIGQIDWNAQCITIAMEVKEAQCYPLKRTRNTEQGRRH